MTKRRKGRGLTQVPPGHLMISVVPTRTEDLLMGLPEFDRFVHLMGVPKDAQEKERLLEVILEILHQDLTEENAVVVRAAMAEHHAHYQPIIDQLQAELAAMQNRVECAEARARQLEGDNARLERFFRAISVPKDLLDNLHRAARDYTMPTGRLHEIVAEARDYLDTIRASCNGFVSE